MNTFVQADMFEPEFPTVTQMGSLDYGKIIVDPETRDSEFMITDLSAVHNFIEIKDQPWEFSRPKKHSFVNLQLNHHLTDLKANYQFD